MSCSLLRLIVKLTGRTIAGMFTTDEAARSRALDLLPLFLGHRFPRVSVDVQGERRKGYGLMRRSAP